MNFMSTNEKEGEQEETPPNNTSTDYSNLKRFDDL